MARGFCNWEITFCFGGMQIAMSFVGSLLQVFYGSKQSSTTAWRLANCSGVTCIKCLWPYQGPESIGKNQWAPNKSLRNSIWSRRISECFVSLLFFSCWGGLGVGAWSGLDLPSTISKPPGGSIWFEKRRTFWGWDLIPHPMYPMYSLEHLALMSSSSSTMDGVSTASTDRATSVLAYDQHQASPSINQDISL